MILLPTTAFRHTTKHTFHAQAFNSLSCLAQPTITRRHVDDSGAFVSSFTLSLTIGGNYKEISPDSPPALT